MTTFIPIFPLRTVLFPGGPLQLRIFETRYLDMVSRCLREDTGFGVCLIADGNEVGEPASPHPVGTLARIVDWNRRQDGLLGITAIGRQRIRIRDSRVETGGLLAAEVEYLPSVGTDSIPPQPAMIHDLLDRIMTLKGLGYGHVSEQRESADWLSCRLAEILPLDMEARQRLLEMDAPLKRLQALQPLVPALRIDSA